MAFEALLAIDYRRFLWANAAAILPLEAALLRAEIANAMPDWSERSRSEALRSDLSQLGLPEPEGKPVAFARRDTPFLCGIVYVLEGSRLGGRIILSRLLGDGTDLEKMATRFLAPGRDGMWPRFWSQIQTLWTAEEATAEMIDGARYAFSRFHAAADDALAMTLPTKKNDV